METLRLELELELGADPICGSLRREHGEREAFCGWLELASALDAICRPAAEQPPPAASRPSRTPVTAVCWVASGPEPRLHPAA